jgi:hypothetical protein
MAGDVAGDFHEIVDLRDGRVAVVVGDAQGFGPPAAAVAEELRSELRQAFQTSDDPSQVLSRLDARLEQRSDDTIATAACAVVEPDTHIVRVANAGHLPLVFADGARVELFDGPADPPLGWSADRRVVSRTLHDGAALFAYTDGLIERRGTGLDESIEALITACTGMGGANAWASEFARRATDVFGQPTDDATVVSLRLTRSAVTTPEPPVRDPVVLRVYVDPGDLRSRTLQDVVTDLAARLDDRLAVDVETVDVTGASPATEDAGVLAAPTIVRVSPGPPVRAIGWFTSPPELAYALKLPLPKEDS